MGSGGGSDAGGGASAAAGEGGSASGAVDARLARLIARARAADGHPPFSDGALAELATELGVSRERVRQIQEEALRRLRTLSQQNPSA